MTVPLRPDSALSAIPSCRTCTATVSECFAAWRSHTIFCCPRCDHGRSDPRPHRDRRPRPTIRSAPRGWTEDGYARHTEHAKRVLHMLTGLGVGRELGSTEGRSEVEARIREFTALLLEDDAHGSAQTTEMPTVPQQRRAPSRSRRRA